MSVIGGKNGLKADVTLCLGLTQSGHARSHLAHDRLVGADDERGGDRETEGRLSPRLRATYLCAMGEKCNIVGAKKAGVPWGHQTT